jgi:hypothetical protein
VSRGQRNGSPRPYSRFSRPEELLFPSSSSSIVLTKLSGPRSRHTTSHKKLVEPGIELGTSGSVARNSDHQTTEAVYFLLLNMHKVSSYLTGSTMHLSSVARNSDHYTKEAVTHFLHTNNYSKNYRKSFLPGRGRGEVERKCKNNNKFDTIMTL